MHEVVPPRETEPVAQDAHEMEPKLEEYFPPGHDTQPGVEELEITKVQLAGETMSDERPLAAVKVNVVLLGTVTTVVAAERQLLVTTALAVMPVVEATFTVKLDNVTVPVTVTAAVEYEPAAHCVQTVELGPEV